MTFQKESDFEEALIKILTTKGWESTILKYPTEQDLIRNWASILFDNNRGIDRLGDYPLTDGEMQQIVEQIRELRTPLKLNGFINGKTVSVKRDNPDDKAHFGKEVSLKIYDRMEIAAGQSRYQIVQQPIFPGKSKMLNDRRGDLMLLINGMPVFHLELKRSGVPVSQAYNQIEKYAHEGVFTGLFSLVQIFVAMNPEETVYFANPGPDGKFNTDYYFHWADFNNEPINDWKEIASKLLSIPMAHQLIGFYTVADDADGVLKVMRSYQYYAASAISDVVSKTKWDSGKQRGGYIWHTTGSGKTLTSFKTAQLASKLDYIDKVLFVVDRKDLDYQTMKEYDRFEKGAANSNTSTAVLKRQLEDDNAKIIITTIQKLATFIKKNTGHAVFDKRFVIIFDECHRSQFGDMHQAITKYFKRYHLFGFTGTPIFAVNAGVSKTPNLRTTAQAFGDQLHAYTIVDAIRDKNVLPFRVEYHKTMDMGENIDDKEVWDINREKAFLAPERIRLITEYILTHFDQKTYRGDKTYTFSVLQNIAEVASANGRQQIEEIKQKQRVSGFNSIFAVSSVDAAKLYYAEFQRQMAESPQRRLKVAVIYSYGANEEETDGILDEENPEDTSALDQSSRDFLDAAIRDYNEMFHTNYSTDGDKFQNYYKDVSLRMKNRELDLLIVVNMFLTGFDATTLNTLWVDKNLKMHGLIQAYSRTNRILNSIKVCGNIVCFRNLQKRTDDALSLFGDKKAGGIALLRGYKDYYFGYTDTEGMYHPGYRDMIEELTTEFPLSEEHITGEQHQKDFIVLFGAVLRMRNLLSSFDDFAGNEILSKRDFQDYLGRYQDLQDEWKNRKPTGEKEDITDDIVFEIELIKQIEINIDYILILVQKYHDSHCNDKEVLITIQKAVDASPELRSKKALIETFIAGINDTSDVLLEWRTLVAEEKEKQLAALIKEENLKDAETRHFIAHAFRDGVIKTTGTDIDNLMPPISRFGGGNRAAKKQTIIEKLKVFFDRFFGI